ncbi:MAG: hypothetical protein F4X39_02455 [Acidobacteriia bacterium]|nr:hypothetical protein [Terriglobia bacterium]
MQANRFDLLDFHRKLSKTFLGAAEILRNAVEDFDFSSAVLGYRHFELTIERRGPIDLISRIESTPPRAAPCLVVRKTG